MECFFDYYIYSALICVICGTLNFSLASAALPSPLGAGGVQGPCGQKIAWLFINPFFNLIYESNGSFGRTNAPQYPR